MAEGEGKDRTILWEAEAKVAERSERALAI